MYPQCVIDWCYRDMIQLFMLKLQDMNVDDKTMPCVIRETIQLLHHFLL